MIATQPPRLGRYQILDEIGKGAMGVVYLAKDPLIGRLVALKTFRMADASDQELAESRERFIREAQSAGILSHPNIVTIHDVVESSEEGTSFIAMEFVRGTDLRELLRRDEPFDLATVSDIVWQVAEALEYAHSKGVVHRDIKPANILLTGDGRVKITDFGIARLNTSNLTHAGQLLGTPNYMAPEQIQGKDVDQRADIFSLGVVIYEMLTRQKPFRGDNLTMVTHRIVHEAPTPLEDYLGEVPGQLKAVLEKALAKDPERRYPRVGELARDLKRVADESTATGALNDTQEVEPVAAAPEPARSEPGAGVRLGRRLGAILAPSGWPPLWRLALAAGITLVLGGAMGGVGLFALRAADTRAADAAADAEIGRRFGYLPWLWRGQALLRQGEPSGAAAAFAEAERRAPQVARIAELRRQAEEQAGELQAQARLGEEALALVEEGEKAFARRRYEEAAGAAQRALALVPGHPRALDLDARATLALGRKLPAPPVRPPPVPAPSLLREPAPASEAPAAAVPQPLAKTPAPVPTEASLTVSFWSERPQGVLTVYVGQSQLLREPFRFVEKSGFLRAREVPGGFDRTVTLPTGPATLRVYVALDRTRSETIEGNFPPGVARTLEIRVSASGELAVRLR
jgi:serine/threonine-protein kinase